MTDSQPRDGYSRASIPEEWADVVSEYEARFSLDFERVLEFSRDVLAELHAEGGDDLSERVFVASERDGSVGADIALFERLANQAALSESDRRDYLGSLLRVYAKLDDSPDACVSSGACLVVAPEREGRILAQMMGWLPGTAGEQPHAKRMGHEGGILLGTTPVRVHEPGLRCAMVDGAIASGATLMAFMDQLRDQVSGFDIYSVHAAPEGVRALARFGERIGREVKVFVGHVSGRLNEKFYAVDPEDPSRLLVGDLGDTIAPVDPGAAG